MSAQIFLTIDQVLDILLGELPDGVYANDRADDPDPVKRSYSSSELRAMATMIADLYSNLENISDNKTITTVETDGLTPWEKNLFATQQDPLAPFLDRQNALLAKKRYIGSLSLPAIASQVHAILDPLGLDFDILPYSGAYTGTKYGAWILGFSALGYDTYLAARDPLYGAQRDMVPLDCNLDYAAAGITAQDLLDIQETAYKYELRIYGHADDDTLARLEYVLTQFEPARSTHRIVNDDPGPVPPT